MSRRFASSISPRMASSWARTSLCKGTSSPPPVVDGEAAIAARARLMKPQDGARHPSANEGAGGDRAQREHRHWDQVAEELGQAPGADARPGRLVREVVE